jgi:hypothetical protein
LFLNFLLEYAIRDVQENEEGLKLNVIYKLPVYAGVNLLGKTVSITKKNTEALLNTTEDIGLQINAEENKYLHVHVL